MNMLTNSWFSRSAAALRLVASLLATSALLSACGGGSLTEVIGVIPTPAAAPAVSLKVSLVDATSQATLSAASVVVSGPGASALAGITPGAEFAVSGGLLTLITKDGQAAPTPGNPIDVTVAASSAGYTKASQRLLIDHGGAQSATLAMTKMVDPPPVVPPAATTGTLVVSVSKSCPDGSNSGTVNDATVSVFAGSSLVASGTATGGSITFTGVPAGNVSVVADSRATGVPVTRSATVGAGVSAQVVCNFTLSCGPVTGGM